MIKNIIAVVAGVVVGTVVNGALIILGHAIIPAPAGVDQTSMESFAATAHLLRSEDFLFPFLAHALGPLAGAFVAVKIAVSHHMKLVLGMGVFFLLGGIVANVMIPAPLWFKALDLVIAYVPTTLLGARLGRPRA
jgi:hypothetical protein